MSISNRSTIAAVLATFERTDTKLPKVVADLHARSQHLKAGIEKLQTTETPSIAHAVAEAILKDSDPFTDQSVLSAVVASHVTSEPMQRQLQISADERLIEAFTEHADEIVKAWRKPFDAAAGDLVTAHDRLGSLELDDAHAILRLGNDIASVWERARTANSTIEKIIDGWAALGMGTNLASPNPRLKLLRLADVPANRMVAEFDHQSIDPWHAVIAGLSLSLPTFAEMQARVRSIEVYRQQMSDEAMQSTRRPGLLSGSSI